MKPETRPRQTGPVTTGSTERQTAPLPPRPAAAAAVPSTPKEPHFMERETVTVHGRRLSPGEFTTAMVHLHRAEVQRSNTWRNRLDTTTNWAVLTAGATLSFAFSSPENPHFVILINTILVAFFLTMEARRYRYYEIWASRVRVVETGFFAQLLMPTQLGNEAEWAEHLAQDLRTPHFTISLWEALGRRLRRNYLWLFALLAASWNLKVYLHPFPARDLAMFIRRAGVGIVPGDTVLLIGIFFNLSLAIFAFATVRLKEATGEVLPTHEFHPIRTMTTTVSKVAQTRRVSSRRTKRARERTRTLRAGATSATQTGEFKRIDTGDLTGREAGQPVEEESLT
ncbi:MAG TPA: DUF2270 domain-containing protein [Pyrinomonadaceae bacterium]|nr:DUF2270 domain-containing protein [Pyrinomonadaceae bacterium]